MIIQRIKKRAGFLKIAQTSFRWSTVGFVLQYKPDYDIEDICVGFTASKKVGNAVLRNRAKRRLKEIARKLLCDYGEPGTGYVFVAKKEIQNLTYQQLLDDATNAFVQITKRIKKSQKTED